MTDRDTAAGSGPDDALLYAYAVARDADLPEGELPGVAGAAREPVRAVRQQGLVVLVGSVPAAEFDQAPLRERLEDLGWLERVARGHQRVVDAAAARACVLPLRLATVYRDERGLRRMLAAGRSELDATLDRLDGRAEWAVKVWTGPGRPAADGPRPRGSGGSGRDYLARRGAERRAREADRLRAEEAVAHVHAALLTLAEEARLHPPRDARLSGRPGRNLLNAAYLVRRERTRAFRSAAGAFADRRDGLRVELSGPWAPYSFVAPRETP
ncbi:GvpL/GvpF family gas vesicle protein [Streptomyces albireticuli]|uniref:Gas vesicle protein n=1 Tax=Streptomyces albireticuli TaxID=1940 RepID=A0A2A2D0I1_9ACTN|nr:GvpL/GvpF family gas vesicle protein [Streptomyces albireticuli]MCD9143539.1 GvpL/GvpF family gas vesicle protein [Streptomyces albireticuli]MCD9164898.1 GvpL/GvpF family gas vesicle protein [Streptomyces albireticuli]MCD9191656.1 GvpL/GvpF family gas vesicle protein [Streptomyces albireticuli]PAU45014.1 gas vesicle protein [Streptomyces albireticuli]